MELQQTDLQCRASLWLRLGLPSVQEDYGTPRALWSVLAGWLGSLVVDRCVLLLSLLLSNIVAIATTTTFAVK